MIKRLKGIVAVLKREAKTILRDKDLITIILLSPLFYAFFYGAVYMNKSEQSVPVVITDMDKSGLSRTLIRSLNASQLAEASEVTEDLSSAFDRLYRMKAHGVIYIPKGFENSLKSGTGADLKIYLNTTKFLISNDINKAVNEVTGTISAGVRLKYFQAQGYNAEQAIEMIEPINCEVKSLFNPVESYGDFMIPGLFVLILHQTLLIGLAESMARERERNTIGVLFKVSNRSTGAAITGKGLFYFVLFSSYAFLFYTLNFSVFRISFRGSASAAAALTLVFLAGAVFLAIFTGSFFKRKIVALQVFAFTSYPFFLMSGYPWPRQSLPVLIEYFSYLLPVTPYLNAINRITQMGAGWQDIVPEFYHLLVLAAAGFIITHIRVRYLIKHGISKTVINENIGIEITGIN